MHGGESASESTRIQRELLELKAQAKEALEAVLVRDKVEKVRVQFLGKKGKVSEILKTMGKLPQELRPVVGQVANEVKESITQYIETTLQAIDSAEREKNLKNSVDISLPGRLHFYGKRHPLSQTAKDITEVLLSLGFESVSGPEIEHDFYNFEALNVPRDHPAREMQDTFYIDDDVVLRTHTSPVQIRTLLSQKELPLRIISFGRVYRRDQDVTHSPVFHQVEGLYVNRQVTFADLKGTLSVFVSRLFSPSTQIRLRPSYFPFTEPSAEVDMSCFLCKGKGCRLCKNTGWIEILGAGMVDPEVFKAAQLDPEKVSGFAFGMGIERIAMLRYGISDIRLFYENDIRFLRQL